MPGSKKKAHMHQEGHFDVPGSIFPCNQKKTSSPFILIQEPNCSIKMLLISMCQEANINQKQISSQFIRIQEANRSIKKMLLISMSQEAYLHAVCGFRTIKKSDNPKYVTSKTNLGIEGWVGKKEVYAISRKHLTWNVNNIENRIPVEQEH